MSEEMAVPLLYSTVPMLDSFNAECVKKHSNR